MEEKYDPSIKLNGKIYFHLKSSSKWYNFPEDKVFMPDVVEDEELINKLEKLMAIKNL